MITVFRSPFIEQAMKLFYEEFSLEHEPRGFASYERKGSEVTYAFPDDSLIRDIRAWGAGALSCTLATSFTVTI